MTIIVPLFILAFFALFLVYVWTDLTELIDGLLEEEVREAAARPDGGRAEAAASLIPDRRVTVYHRSGAGR